MNTIIQVVQHMRPGGIETMVLDLISLNEKKERSFIVSLEGNKKSAIDHWPRLKSVEENLIFLNKKSGPKPNIALQLSRLFKRLDVDVVHTHHIGPLLYAGIAARLAGVKRIIYTEHDAWHLEDPKQRNLEKWAIRLVCPQLVADANIVADTMRKQLHCNNDIRVIHNGIDTERFIPGNLKSARQKMGLPQDVYLIGCSGRLEEVKGQKYLIQALALLPEKMHLSLAGIGSMETELRHLVESLNLDNRVHFLGRIDDMPTFYQSLDIFCQPSLSEGLPLSPLEAQACNIPAVITDVGGSRETLCPISGLLMPAGNIDAMAISLRKTLSHTHITNPRRFVQQHGDVRMMAQGYAALRHAGG
ncbi:MAG: glycosyltransferase [Ectothiorhodospiraceae bacterium]|nr:glycosyltransferase [Ectothiorhodospiraceae bacterium]